MMLWERFRAAVKSENTTQEWVASQTRDPEVKFRTLQGWISKGVMPPADKLYSLARILNTTVEWLVAGDEGSAYLHRMYGYSFATEAAEQMPTYGPDRLITDIARLSAQDREEIQALVNVKLSRALSQSKHA